MGLKTSQVQHSRLWKASAASILAKIDKLPVVSE
jgi:hypothetical protein